MSSGLKGMDKGVDIGGRLIRRRPVVVRNLCAVQEREGNPVSEGLDTAGISHVASRRDSNSIDKL